LFWAVLKMRAKGVVDLLREIVASHRICAKVRATSFIHSFIHSFTHLICKQVTKLPYSRTRRRKRADSFPWSGVQYMCTRSIHKHTWWNPTMQQN